MTDRQADRPTDEQMDIATYRSAIADKNKKNLEKIKDSKNTNKLEEITMINSKKC